MITNIFSLLRISPSNIINWFKKYSKVIAAIIILVFSAIFVFQYKQLQKKDAEVARVTNNYLYYEQLASQLDSKNLVLQFTVDEYKETNDSLIQQAQTIQKKLKIKDKELQQIQVQKTSIKLDTTVVLKNIVKTNDFTAEIKPNELTSIIITRKDSILNTKLDIRNTQTLFIQSKKEYRHKYKNWFCRLLKFDFKKDIRYKYQINNSNEIIKVEDTRLIEISK